MITKYSDFREDDFLILRFILKHGIVTTRQIMTHTDSMSRHAVYRRLRKLENARLIWRKKLASKLNVYFPHRDARDYLNYPVTVSNDASFYTAQHDLIINDLILYLRSAAASDFEYKTEREYRFELLKGIEDRQAIITRTNETRDSIPDFILYPPTLAIAVEVELTVKKATRLRKKIDLYANQLKNGEYTDVWYFVPDNSVGNAIKKAVDYVHKTWAASARTMTNTKGINVFQQIQIRALPSEVKGED